MGGELFCLLESTFCVQGPFEKGVVWHDKGRETMEQWDAQGRVTHSQLQGGGRLEAALRLKRNCSSDWDEKIPKRDLRGPDVRYDSESEFSRFSLHRSSMNFKACVSR